MTYVIGCKKINESKSYAGRIRIACYNVYKARLGNYYQTGNFNTSPLQFEYTFDKDAIVAMYPTVKYIGDLRLV